ncbi:NAD-dependent epimerase/dehydratase family protein [Anaeromicropila herbilytica]|uniref:UDP-glucose 4-epimerase n=1 Tax=Anaeromicropila herbilytica TaxID=2785025 RepID=A0A7R7IDZ1_9FIRM|nr:NAD-dependent epimerase/dehydratase family protein [Anaeromicropila herbilytica]BCN32223.1 UDP-glucose 4-epimerase [Anaeromicropila herbilytica]
MYKRILVTGKNSYVGNSFLQWIGENAQYVIDTISMRDGNWVNTDLSIYDTIFHVAGIAHVEAKDSMESTYYKVNRDMTIDLAKKAKQTGVRQFIYMSSIIVYGENNRHNSHSVITKDTVPNPSGFYGRSKLEAEEGLLQLQDDNFHIAIVRAPMIYGKGSKGNYPRLARLARILPMFPKVRNRRSILYIDNLCEFVKMLIDNEERGIFFPQNKEYCSTTELVQEIARVHGKRVIGISCFNLLIKLSMKRINMLNKIFGTLVYDLELSSYREFSYCKYDMKSSIELTEKK